MNVEEVLSQRLLGLVQSPVSYRVETVLVRVRDLEDHLELRALIASDVRPGIAVHVDCCLLCHLWSPFLASILPHCAVV